MKENKSWSFSNVSRSDTNYLTHGYHKYPAKFIPQIVSKLLIEYSSEGDTILDPFGGCGTTLVESKINNRNSVGIDINDVAVLIAQTKTSPISPKLLEKSNEQLLEKFEKIKVKKNYYNYTNERLKYWFNKKEFNILMEMYKIILKIKDKKIRRFYLCCFSNILKNCSIWYSKSIKPMKDLNKNIPEPIQTFTKHLKFMTNKNKEFSEKIIIKKNLNSTCIMKKGDSRNLPLKNDSIDLVITSPPYVTSYEYAELHQISTLWFGYAKNMNEIKKDFVGTSSRKDLVKQFQSKIAEKIIKQLSKKDKSLAKHSSNYFSDLEKSYREIYRVLKSSGIACIIIGNTEYKSVKVKNVEASVEILENLGFKKLNIIKRRLSSKTFTPFRDKEGKFTNSREAANKKIYNYEYILIFKK